MFPDKIVDVHAFAAHNLKKHNNNSLDIKKGKYS
jgi:hypothetical protein